MIISEKTFLTYVEAIAAEKPTYKERGYGADGTCDCIGLIIGAIRRAGGSWTGKHGSNYTARYQINGLRKIIGTGDLQIGEIVFKAREPGHRLYDLPRSYDSSPDRRDYYHVGVVISVYPLRIRHMTTPGGMTVDTSIGKWDYHGWLKKIQGSGTTENGGNEMTNQDEQTIERVIIQGGNLEAPVNMRQGNGRDRQIIRKIPQGAEAELLMYGETWCKIRYEETVGYVATQFVKYGPTQGDAETITIEKKKLETIYDQIGDLLGLRG